MKGLDVPGLVGGRTSWRETLLLLPGLLLILDESRKVKASALAKPYRGWLREMAAVAMGADLLALPPSRQLTAIVSPVEGSRAFRSGA